MSHVATHPLLAPRTVVVVLAAIGALAAGVHALRSAPAVAPFEPAARVEPPLSAGAAALRRALSAEMPPTTVALPAPASAAQLATQPWEEVRDRIAGMVFGAEFDREAVVLNQAGFDSTGRFRPDYASVKWNPRGARIGEREQAELDARADAFGPIVRERAEALADELTYALADAWERGDFVRRPVGEVDSAQIAEASQRGAARSGFAYADSFTHAGWMISIAVHGADRPGLRARVLALNEMRALRESELRASIAALP